ncbi:hypothetical protein CE91St46_35070 [Eubacteriales bacterium]|nr:hypothetical protein CE91St46_35070 [Eubacteriales bacterium]GKH65118.1 hypothetical protein CE91St47_35870 [Eubacteriales bacterium]SFJ27235.1 hypothetical protein SAMN02910435_01679 [Ruminococcaceae bacterium D5]
MVTVTRPGPDAGCEGRTVPRAAAESGKKSGTAEANFAFVSFPRKGQGRVFLSAKIFRRGAVPQRIEEEEQQC